MGNETSKKRISEKSHKHVKPLNTKVDLFTLRSFNTVKEYQDIPDSTFLITKVHIRLSGASGVGKSSLAYRYLCDNLKPATNENDRKSCNFQNFAMRLNNVDLDLKFVLTDFTGNNIADIQRAGFHFVVYDITNRRSYDLAQQIIATLYRSTLSHYGFTKYIVLVANKADLNSKAEVSDEEAAELARKFNVEFRKVSAVHDHRKVVRELFDGQIKLYAEHRLKNVEEKKKEQFDYLMEQRNRARQFGVVSKLGSTYFLDS